jgi:hypothetical protein
MFASMFNISAATRHGQWINFLLTDQARVEVDLEQSLKSAKWFALTDSGDHACHSPLFVSATAIGCSANA